MPLSLQISARILTWPHECACCGAEPNGHLKATASRVIGTRTERTTYQWWDVPYCDQCLGHVRAYERPSMWASAGLVASTVVAIAVGMYAHAGFAAASFAVIMAVAVSLHFSAQQQSRYEAAARMGKTCAAAHRSVLYTEWYGTMHTLIFVREHYLDAFLSMNAEKARSAITNTETNETLRDPPPQPKRNASRVRRSRH